MAALSIFFVVALIAAVLGEVSNTAKYGYVPPKHTRAPSTAEHGAALNHAVVGFGNCKPYCERDKLRALLPSFLATYKRKPWKENRCGCQVNHCMSSFMVAALSRAASIVENGVNAGMSGFLFRAAAPAATVYHIDPLPRPICDPERQRWRDPGLSYYLTGDNFTDFAQVDWSRAGLNKKETLVFFDTHQPDARIVADAIENGFSTFLLDDNYPAVDPNDMQDLSLKTVFAKNASEAKHLYRLLNFYFEMPPLINPLDAPHSLRTKYPQVFTQPAECRNGRRKHCNLRIDAADQALGLVQSPLLNLHDPTDASLFETVMSSGAVQPMEFWWYNHMAVLGAKPRRAF